MAARARVNPTEFAILGLLAERARSGYDIKTDVEQRLSYFWSESYGHIYPMLRRLLQRKLIAVRAVRRQRGRPERRIYSITAEGRRALAAWFDAPPSVPRPRNELLLRLFLGRHSRRETLVRDVAEYRAHVAGTLRRLREVDRVIDADASSDEDRLYWKLTVSFGVKVFAALEEWSKSAAAELKRDS